MTRLLELSPDEIQELVVQYIETKEIDDSNNEDFME
jgi:hypothetical protein